MANIKNLVVAGTVSVAAAIAGGLIIKRLQAKNEAEAAEAQAAFEKAEADLQAKQAERSAAVKQHNKEIFEKLEEEERISNEIRDNIDRAYNIETAVGELKKKFETARSADSDIPDTDIDQMIKELHQLAKDLDEVKAANNGYLKGNVCVTRTCNLINEVHDIVTDYKYFEKKEA